MSPKQLLNLDINKLFEEHNVKDIEQIQKTIQQESDRKKIELRTLVGERYRDLIKAADTIAEMTDTSRNVILRIVEIEKIFRHLQQKYLVGFKFDAKDKSNYRDLQNVSESVMLQIKILMDIPEHIWSAIDNRDLLLASQLFTLAQHVNYSLTFEVGQSVLAYRYPIVAKQWRIISHFRNVILNECNDILQSLDLSTKTAANCLAGLVFMEGTTSKDLLEKLICLRSRAIESIIIDESPHSVRQRVQLSVKLLTDSVALIHSCFINVNDHSRGLIAEYVNDLMDQQASSMLYNLDLDNALLEQFLPTVTKSHKPFAKGHYVDLLSSDLNERLENWLRWIKEFTSREISKLLNLVTSVRGIYNIREESLAVSLPENWEKLRNELSFPTNFWSEFYQLLLTKRVKEIIYEKWQEALKALKDNFSDLIAKINNEKYEFPEHDLRWLVWKDSPMDIPQNLTKNANVDPKRCLLMKSRGYSPNLVKFCENFDKSLNQLLLDLEQYLYNNESTKSVKENLLALSISSVADKFTDRSEIQEHLQNVSSLMIENLVKFIKSEYVVPQPRIGRFEVNAIITARFFQALTVLCPSVNTCFTLSKSSGLMITNVRWQSVCDYVKDESTSIWLIWANSYRVKVKEYRQRFLNNEATNEYQVGTIISDWEKVTIEEEADEGKRIKSEILVPYQPSVNLQKFLAALMRDFNKIIPHTVPKKVIHEIVDHVATELFDYFDGAAKNSNRQKQAFQILFDIKYVTLMMVSRENKNLIDRSMEVGNSVLVKIDPFDSDVFYPFIHANVKKSIQRSLLIFGNLVPHIEQLYSVLGSRSDYASNDGSKSKADPPGGLAVCSGAPWFLPLAVTAPTRNLPLVPAMPNKAQLKKTAVKEVPKNDFGGATIKSGAAAFFGAMGSDWFSTS